MSGGKNTFSIKADWSAAEALFDRLSDGAEQAIRPAAQAAAQVLYDEVKSNVSRIKRDTGKLAGSIYQAYSVTNSSDKRATYHVSWNHTKAPHGYLVEYGHLQRYEIVRDKQGRFYPAVRPGMEGTRKPGRRASQAVKDAYWVTLPTPIQIPGKAFVRSAKVKFPQAVAAATKVLLEKIGVK
jgi:hypothetical protein